MQRPKTNLKTQGIQSSERHTCSGHNAQTNDYLTTYDMRAHLNNNLWLFLGSASFDFTYRISASGVREIGITALEVTTISKHRQLRFCPKVLFVTKYCCSITHSCVLPHKTMAYTDAGKPIQVKMLFWRPTCQQTIAPSNHQVFMCQCWRC